jgi:DNA-directed RNA polymerase subunit F
MVDEIPKRKFDDFDKRKFKEFTDELRLLAKRDKICNKLVEMLFDKDPGNSFLAKDFLEYHDRHFYPNIKDILEVADIVLNRSLNSKVDKKSS